LLLGLAALPDYTTAGVRVECGVGRHVAFAIPNAVAMAVVTGITQFQIEIWGLCPVSKLSTCRGGVARSSFSLC
jgi:hypothetical protein